MSATPPTAPTFTPSIRYSPILKAVVVGGLILGLQIPVLFIAWLVSDRENRRTEAVAEISQSWGREQQIAGPYLVIPSQRVVTDTLEDGRLRDRIERSTNVFLPTTLSADGTLETETRNRGIYEAAVYTGAFTLSGQFEPPDFIQLGVDPSEVDWDRAQVVFEVSDARAIQKAVELTWGGEAIPFEPGTGHLPAQRAGIHAPLGAWRGEAPTDYRLELTLNGSVSLRFAPFGKTTDVNLSGDWPDPSFQGAWIPTDREVQSDSFTARWSIPYLGRDYPQAWSNNGFAAEIYASQFGVDLLTPVDAYTQTERSLKYQILFLGLTLGTIWLFEILAGVRLHFIQYALIGASLCLFYLLELSLAEHIGFALAYALAAAAVVIQVFAYSASVMKSAARGAVLAAVATSLYGCLLVLIRLQDFALLVGSIGLFVILALIMYLTRKVDWFQTNQVPSP